jgi:hypothetical protein
MDNLYLFPLYRSRQEYQTAFGQEPPPWNANRLPKFWFDPKAKDIPKRNVVYDVALALDDHGNVVTDANGTIQLDNLLLTKEEASTVNIPPGGTNVPGAAEPPVPCPMRPLEPNEELFFDFGGVLAVKNTQLYNATLTGFTAEDRNLLKAIAKKLGV